MARAALIAALVAAAAAAGAALGTAAVALALPAALAGALLRRRAEASAQRRRRPARQDPLTGLGDRALLADRLDYEIVRHGRQERALAVLALDLDATGGAARDEARVAAAQALRRTVRAQDTVARIGAAAFCVLAPETDRYAATHLAARVREAVVAAAGGPGRSDLAVGVALYPHDARGAQQLLTRAHAAAVQAGRAEDEAPARRAA